MIPKLYQKDGTTLIGDLTNCIECLVEEERNGIFEVTFQYPNTESIATSLVYDNIVICDANDTLKNQKFRIYDTRRMMNNTIDVYARHISFDLAYDYINSIDITNQSCEYSLNTIFRNSQFSTGYVGHSDIVNAQNYKISNCNALEAIAGKQGSIIDTYGTGAEILRDNTDIYVLNRRGNDNEVSIEYAKNLTGFELQEDTDDLITRIIPFATYTPDGGEQTRVQGSAVDSSYINNYSHPFIAELDFSDKFKDKETPTPAKLNTMAQLYFEENKCDLPKQNWKIEFIPLSKCVGYESIKDAISLCDTVTIKDTRYSINTKAKVIKTVYDVLRERYDSMELGEPRTTLGDIVNTGSEKGEQGPPGPQGPKGEDGNIGDFPDSVPAKPVLTTTLLGFASIQLDWTYENKPYYWYEVYASKTKDFTPNLFDIVHKGQTSSFLFQAKPGETWYFRVCGVNSYDHRSEFSDQIEVITTKVDDLSNYFTTAAIGNAVVGSLTADYMTAGILKGNWIDAKNLSVTDGNGKRTLDIDSFGNVNLDVTTLRIASKDVSTIDEMNSAITQKANEITSTVSSTYATKSTVNDLSNNLAQNYPTTVQMNSAITQKAGEITNTVEENIDNKYATKTLVTQTANEVRYEFQQGGAFPNLVKNGSPTKNNSTGFNLHQSKIYTQDANYNELGFYAIVADNHGALYTDRFYVTPGKTYSISFWVFAEQNVVNPRWYVAHMDDADRTNISWVGMGSLPKYTGSGDKWTKIEANVTVPSGKYYMELQWNVDHTTASNNFVTRIDRIMVCEGKDIFPNRWYPKPQEIQSNATTIDMDGVNVRHSDGARTNLNATALNFYNSSNKLYAQVNGGIYKFWYGDTYVGYIGHSKWVEDETQRVITVNSKNYSSAVSLGVPVSSSDLTPHGYVNVFPRDIQIGDNLNRMGTTIYGMHTKDIIKFWQPSNGFKDGYPSWIGANENRHIVMAGVNGVYLGILSGTQYYSGIFVEKISGSPYKTMHFYGDLDMHNWTISNFHTSNQLSAVSAASYALKNSSDKDNYSDPTADTVTDIFPIQSSTDGEIHWSDRKTHFTSEWEEGLYEAYIEIPWWIAQNLESNYHVTITPTNGFFQYYVSEKDPYYFIVRSDKDSMGFTFEINGKLLENNTLANNVSIAGDQYKNPSQEQPESPLPPAIPLEDEIINVEAEETGNNI